MRVGGRADGSNQSEACGSSPDRSSTKPVQATTRGAVLVASAIGVGSNTASWVSWPNTPKSPAPGRSPRRKRCEEKWRLRMSIPRR